MTTKTMLIGAGIALTIWLLWPRRGIPMFTLDPVIIYAGGEPNE